ncbi:hypothetical protein GN956_G1528 [Arapaima gigas]
MKDSSAQKRELSKMVAAQSVYLYPHSRVQSIPASPAQRNHVLPGSDTESPSSSGHQSDGGAAHGSSQGNVLGLPRSKETAKEQPVLSVIFM